MPFTDFQSQLAEHNLAMTESRRIVFTLIKNADNPMTAQEVVEKVPLTDRATVYRTLATFVDTRILHNVMIDGAMYYELGEKFVEHHHHIYCSRCKTIETFVNKDIEKAIVKTVKKQSFESENHHIVIYGTHTSCFKQIP